MEPPIDHVVDALLNLETINDTRTITNQLDPKPA